MEHMGVILEILIPTFQRAECLKKNLEQLCDSIRNIDCNKISIYISDNCSQDHTQQVVLDVQRNNPEIIINYQRHDHNIGLEPNVVSLMGRATSKYVMWLGDDDYLAPGYLKFALESVSSKTEIGCILTGTQDLLADGTIKEGRQEAFDLKPFDKGYETVYCISHLAHQMSGIVLFREGLLDSYLDKTNYRNPYLFIYWSAKALFDRGGIYAPTYKTTITTFNSKDWGYNKVGLLDEVFKSYFYFEDIFLENEMVDILIRFSVLHSYRYKIERSRPFRLFNQYKYLSAFTRRYNGFSKRLFIHLLKDYIKVLIR